jgi:hypothetical protein
LYTWPHSMIQNSRKYKQSVCPSTDKWI